MNAAGHLAVEADSGSATSWGPSPDSSWLVRVRREDRSVIVSFGLSRTAAERLAERIAEMICGGGEHRGGRR